MSSQEKFTERQTKHPKSRSVESMRLMAGALCLDFLNTKAFRPVEPREWLRDYGDLLTFARRTAILEETALQKLTEHATAAAADPKRAADVTEAARNWREALYRSVTGQPEPGDLERINDVLTTAHAHRKLEATRDGEFVWVWEPDTLELPLWIIALNAADLLTAGLVSRVHLCPGSPGHACGWVFLDVGRGKARRWCAMDLCGNRAKVKKHRDNAALEPN
jgi:predicted RNA-binding Zn ribbon-like protein